MSLQSDSSCHKTPASFFVCLFVLHVTQFLTGANFDCISLVLHRLIRSNKVSRPPSSSCSPSRSRSRYKRRLSRFEPLSAASCLLFCCFSLYKAPPHPRQRLLSEANNAQNDSCLRWPGAAAEFKLQEPLTADGELAAGAGLHKDRGNNVPALSGSRRRAGE